MHDAREPVVDPAPGSLGVPAIQIATCGSPAGGAPPLRVAYLVNQYPKVSHSFIRREILALERRGVTVDRIAIRGWDADVVDPADIAELGRTRFVLKNGVLPVLAAALRQCVRRPRAFGTALRAALAMSRRAERPLPYHLIYLAQACLILEWLRESDACHLHAHFGNNPAEVAMFVRLLGGPPYSYTAHGPEENDVGAFLGIDRKVRHAKFVVAVSSHTRSQVLRRAAQEDWHKVKVVHCGLDAQFYEPSIDVAPTARQFVCVARLDAEKGQLVLLEAIDRLRERYPDCRLVLAGDGDMRSVLEARIRALQLDQHVRITGWITSDQVREEILAARALVLPSFQEGLPVVLMEAMALKRPVIATQIAGIPELVQPGRTGWLVPAGSVAGLAAAMEDCLAAPIDDLRGMGENARVRVMARHSIEREVTKLSNLLRGRPEDGW